MPIYEYRCGGCNRRVSLFFRSFSAAASGAAEARCPNCGSDQLSRMVSKISVIRANRAEPYSPDFNAGESEDFVGTGEDYEDAESMPGLDEMMAGVDEEDPRSVARWARQMQSQMGEDLGPDFNSALTRIESGEDPEKVLDDMDPAMGMGGMDSDGDFDD